MANYSEYQKKEISLNLNAFNKPAEYSAVEAWVKQITNLLFTRPGTYSTDPKLGVGIQDYRYAFFDDSKLKLEQIINQQRQRYLPDIPVGNITLSGKEVKGMMVGFIKIPITVESELKTAYVAIDTKSKTLKYEVAF